MSELHWKCGWTQKNKKINNLSSIALTNAGKKKILYHCITSLLHSFHSILHSHYGLVCQAPILWHSCDEWTSHSAKSKSSSIHSPASEKFNNSNYTANCTLDRALASMRCQVISFCDHGKLTSTLTTHEIECETSTQGTLFKSSTYAELLLPPLPILEWILKK